MSDEKKKLTLDEELLNEQLEALRARREEGWLITRLDKAPTVLPGCDDHANRFAWYSVEEPDGEPKKGEKQRYTRHGYVHFEKHVEV